MGGKGAAQNKKAASPARWATAWRCVVAFQTHTFSNISNDGGNLSTLEKGCNKGPNHNGNPPLIGTTVDNDVMNPKKTEPHTQKGYP